MTAQHPTLIEATVTCTGCGAKHQLNGAYRSAVFTVEQCKLCHRAYTGKKEKSRGDASGKFSKFKGFAGLVGSSKKTKAKKD